MYLKENFIKFLISFNNKIVFKISIINTNTAFSSILHPDVKRIIFLGVDQIY